jgi:hypothetical protein
MLQLCILNSSFLYVSAAPYLERSEIAEANGISHQPGGVLGLVFN